MMEIAEAISRDFHYCRVDFYEVEGRLYFGEVTFFHGTGMQWFEPREYAMTFGDLIHL